MQSEGDLTAPSGWCPNPQLWSAEDDQSAEVEVSQLVGALVRALKPGLVVETGTAHGFTAVQIGQALADNGHGHLVTLETNADLVAEAQGRCAGLPVEVVHGSSLDWSPNEHIGFAWFDSLIGLRVPEFDRYREWMTPGTVVGFHDVAPHFGDWGKNLAQHPHLYPIFLRTPRGVCLAEVR